MLQFVTVSVTNKNKQVLRSSTSVHVAMSVISVSKISEKECFISTKKNALEKMGKTKPHLCLATAVRFFVAKCFSFW